jgi:fucose 4-O-acetylase-like acetyltransferase
MQRKAEQAMMEQSTGRIEYYDIAKAYLIFLVIIGHVLNVINPGYAKLHFSVIQSFISAFHMPAFFILHGVLFNNEKWRKRSVKEFILKRVYTLIIPYLFFEIIGIIWKWILGSQDVLTGLYNIVTIRCNIGADWFLPAMFLGSLLYLIYVKFTNRICGVVSVLISFILPMFMDGNQFLIVVGRGLLAYGFIMIGHVVREFLKSEHTKSIFNIILALLITGTMAVISLKWGNNDFYTCIINTPVVFLIGGGSGTYLIVGISRLFQCKVLSCIGRHTLTIMGTHQLFIYALSDVLLQNINQDVAVGIILLLIIIVLDIPVVFILDRYLPFLVGRKSSIYLGK